MGTPHELANAVPKLQRRPSISCQNTYRVTKTSLAILQQIDQPRHNCLHGRRRNCDAGLKNCEEALLSRSKPGSVGVGVRAGRMTDNQLARALLLSSLDGSACSGFGRQTLKAESLCEYLKCNADLPTHQWRVEARH